MPLTSSPGDSAEDPPSESGRADFRGGDRNEANGQLFSALLSRIVPVDTAVGDGNAIINIVTYGVPSAATAQPSIAQLMEAWGQMLSCCTHYLSSMKL